MTNRPDSEEPEPAGGRAAERLRDFLRRRSIESDEEQPPAGEKAPEPEKDAAEDDEGR
jgi:hypothetical protein